MQRKPQIIWLVNCLARWVFVSRASSASQRLPQWRSARSNDRLPRGGCCATLALRVALSRLRSPEMSHDWLCRIVGNPHDPPPPPQPPPSIPTPFHKTAFCCLEPRKMQQTNSLTSDYVASESQRLLKVRRNGDTLLLPMRPRVTLQAAVVVR